MAFAGQAAKKSASLTLKKYRGDVVDLGRLEFWMQDIALDFVEIDGRLFVDRRGNTESDIVSRVRGYEDIVEAQYWINIVPFTALIEDFVGVEWDIFSPEVEGILKAISKIWTYQLRARFEGFNCKVETWKSEEDGDVGLKLIQP